VLLIVLFPFVRGVPGAIVFSFLFSLLLINSSLTALARRSARIGGLLLVLLAIFCRWSFFLFGGTILDGLSYFFGSLAFGLISIMLFRDLFKTSAVTTKTIWQAISVYLLVGMTWACMFAFMEVLTPGSFEDGAFPDQAISFATLIYYSFVTLATLGYGDILPATQEARGVVIVEVLMGVLYMAILISRLVGTWKPSEEREEK
jgi:hypothetical protein